MKKKKKDPAAVKLGRKGGQTRVAKRTPEELSAEGTARINARWAKKKGAPAT